MESASRTWSHALHTTTRQLQAPPFEVDCIAVGVSSVATSSVRINDILYLDGEIHDEPERLRSHCASLITLWQAVRAPSLVDLDACTCVGRKFLMREPKPSRRFAIHALHLDPEHVLFAVISSMRRWEDVEHVKRELADLTGRAGEVYRDHGSPSPSALPAAPQDIDGYQFTAREVEILRLLGSGMSNKEIARTLGSSPNTVRNQVHAVFRKAEVSNRTELAIRFKAPH